ATYPRLPRVVADAVRRRRQLLARAGRADGVPRGRRGLHRPDPWHEHQRRHLGSDRRGRTRAVAGPRLPVQGELNTWRRRHWSTRPSGNRSSRCGPTPAAVSAAARTRSTASSGCAGFACARWRACRRAVGETQQARAGNHCEKGDTAVMTMTDPIADFLTRLRNANAAYHDEVRLPHSKIKANIAEILKNEGYIADYRVEDARVGKALVIQLKYGPNRERSLAGLRRVSKPGLRVYAKSTNLPRVLGGLGVAIISTSSGLLTDRQAARQGVGGEVLAYVW